LKEPLSIQSANAVVLEILDSIVKDPEKQKVIYIGNSLGGYLGFEIVGKNPTRFAGAIICGAGQNTGTGASLSARLGLKFLALPMKLPKKSVMNALISSTRGAQIQPELLEICCLRSGIYFEQGYQQIEILKTFNPTLLSNFEKPVLFVNGSKDHHDSQDRWKALVKQGELVVFPNADHFFSHDDRFLNPFIKLIDDFSEKCF